MGSLPINDFSHSIVYNHSKGSIKVVIGFSFHKILILYHERNYATTRRVNYMLKFMVVCTFRPDTSMDQVTAMVPEEMAMAKILKEEGVLDFVMVSTPRDKVFLSITTSDTVSARAIAQRLPMSKWWEMNIYQIATPV